MSTFCPVPHTSRDQVWLSVGFGVGVVAGTCFAKALLSNPAIDKDAPAPSLVRLSTSISGRAKTLSEAIPKRLFKLAIKAEVEAFKAAGAIESTLDKADGFVHLSDRSSPPKVAGLFFKDAADLYLIELDGAKLCGPTQWILGQMGDSPPAPMIVGAAPTTVHYLIADGCVHVYGSSVEWSAVSRPPEHLPLGPDGVHVMPTWL